MKMLGLRTLRKMEWRFKMSTRAVYTFRDIMNDGKQYHVYKHHDGYPQGAMQWIRNAIPFAWQAPRFEPSDFACAFVCGNKGKGGGGIYLTHHWEEHGDLEYRYEIFMDGEIKVDIFEKQYGLYYWRKIDSGISLNDERYLEFAKVG